MTPPTTVRRALALALGVLLALAAGAAAQNTAGGGRIIGHVRAANGDPLPGVMITLQRAGTATPVVDVSDGQGAYTFTALAAGRYAVSFTLPNFTAVQRSDISVIAGELATVDAKIGRASCRERV